MNRRSDISHFLARMCSLVAALGIIPREVTSRYIRASLEQVSSTRGCIPAPSCGNFRRPSRRGDIDASIIPRKKPSKDRVPSLVPFLPFPPVSPPLAHSCTFAHFFCHLFYRVRRNFSTLQRRRKHVALIRMHTLTIFSSFFGKTETLLGTLLDRVGSSFRLLQQSVRLIIARDYCDDSNGWMLSSLRSEAEGWVSKGSWKLDIQAFDVRRLVSYGVQLPD